MYWFFVKKNIFETDYVGNKIYENGVRKIILTENEYIKDRMYYFYIKVTFAKVHKPWVLPHRAMISVLPRG